MLATLIKKGTGDAASQMPARSVTFGTRYAAYRMPGRVFGGDQVCVQRFKIFKCFLYKKGHFRSNLIGPFDSQFHNTLFPLIGFH